ncbi:MAG: S-layer homology domain-containing protein [Syntrophothermus sp.]|uniref:S-layer homology domain-containing protein n=1 Tax=Syntrophothermus sp. TaxID=2736299 RepID=UPI002580C899|nr:S-layer homology domain-containing protein [Syntrophothermus sp.]NSW82107.1 S-layer homology domain-containing protein [Syntrophothermus sp.]
MSMLKPFWWNSLGKRVFATVLAVFLAGTMVLSTAGAGLAFTGFDPGVSDGQEYQEVVFVAGTPQVFKGTVKETSRDRGDSRQVTLTYKLVQVGGDGKLTRNVKLTYNVQRSGAQEVQVMSLDGYTESLTLGKTTYKLDKDKLYFSGSQAIDHRPAVDFWAGNWYMKKVYVTGRGSKNQITVESVGKSEGYSNAWGKGDTRIIDVSVKGEPSDGEGWEGSARITMNDTLSRSLAYVSQGAELSSFDGGFVDETRTQQVMTVEYDLPSTGSEGIDDDRRNEGTLELSSASPAQQKRLFIKEFKDLRGHWAKEAVESLCGLGAIDGENAYFYPNLPARRGDFIRALVTVAGMTSASEENTAKSTRRTKNQATTPLFYDVDSSSPYFKYVQIAGEKGLVDGKIFGLNDNITRAEAAVLLVKAMGLENLSPGPETSTGFYDDALIPLWAKESVYVAQEYGIIGGETAAGANFFRPNDIVTRAEMAAMLDRFREFLNRDFSKDYRDRLYEFSRS